MVNRELYTPAGNTDYWRTPCERVHLKTWGVFVASVFSVLISRMLPVEENSKFPSAIVLAPRRSIHLHPRRRGVTRVLLALRFSRPYRGSSPLFLLLSLPPFLLPRRNSTFATILFRQVCIAKPIISHGPFSFKCKRTKRMVNGADSPSGCNDTIIFNWLFVNVSDFQVRAALGILQASELV